MLDLQSVLIQAIQFHESGQLDQALELYFQLLEQAPEHPTFLHLVGLLHHQKKQYSKAVEYLKQALKYDNQSPQIPYDLGNAYQANSQFEEAIEAYQQALQLNPDYSEALNNYGVIKQEQQKYSEALDLIQQAIQLNPAYIEAHFNLGNIQKELENPEAAIEAYHQAIELNPNYDKAWNNLGLIYQQQEDFEQAINALQKAIHISPDYADAHFNLGQTYDKSAEYELAIEPFNTALNLDPQNMKIYYNLGTTYIKSKQFDSATDILTRSLNIENDNPNIWVHLGQLYMVDQMYDDAIEAHQKVVNKAPEQTEAWYLLGQTYYLALKVHKAIETLQKVLEIEPQHIPANFLMLSLLNILLKEEESFKYYQKCYDLNLDNSNTHSALLFHLFCRTNLTMKEQFKYFREWEEHLKLAPLEKQQSHNKEPHRRLKVGYISPDFRFHSAATLFETIFSCHNDKEFEIYSYSDVRKPDEFTYYFRSWTHHWREVQDLSTEELAALIQADQIDILVDLAGHTKNNRLEVFALKPAPIQIAGLGFGRTTGLSAIDYRMTDPYLSPPHTSQLNSEKLVYLPSLMQWQSPNIEVNITESPHLNNHYITFGCGNTHFKLNRKILAIWAEILKQVPDSKLILKNMALSVEDIQIEYLKYFEELGIEKERIKFLGATSLKGHLYFCNEIDIALDPFPYHGGITTCEVLWMGVPVVTLDGYFRAGTTILKQVQLDELIASSEAEYIEIATNLAQDSKRLTEYKRTLRKQILNSPLCSPFHYTHSIEKAYRTLWMQWCQK